MTDQLSWLVRRWWLAPVAFVVIAGSLATNTERFSVADRPAVVLPVVLAALAILVLFAVDRWPSAVVANGALVSAYFALGGADGPIFLTLVVAAFLVASRREPRVWFPLVLLSVVLVWGGLVVRGVRSDELGIGLGQSLVVGALVAAAVSLATTLRARREARADRVRRAASEEELRMARDLHDGVGHGLAVISMQAGVALHVLDRDPAAVRPALEAIRDTSREALESLRTELSALAGEPAARAPRRGLADVPQLVDRVGAAGPTVRLTGSATDGGAAIPEDVDAAAYAVVQEALTNVLRHADAQEVVVHLERSGDTLLVAVTDDGRATTGHDEGMGLRGMRERVTALGGQLTAAPGPTGGFEVRARLPLVPGSVSG